MNKNIIAFIPRGTGSGHNMRTYSIAKKYFELFPKDEGICFLESLKSTFEPMFKDAGIKVIDVNKNESKDLDYSDRSVLSNVLNWDNVITKFLGPSMFNSEKVFLLLKYFEKYKNISTVVTDLDLSAIVAGSIARKKIVLITERYGSTISLISSDKLKNAGFSFEENEMNGIQKTMKELFDWCLDLTDLIITDCPYNELQDDKTYFKKLLDNGKAKFVGPIIRDKKIFSPKIKRKIFSSLNIPFNSILITASIGGTSMFVEDKKKMQNFYLEVFDELHKWNSNIKMLLLSRDNSLKVPDGVISLKYLPNWYSLLQSSDLVLAHPGWITVTELSALQIPAIFCLSSPKEYHEWDEFIRLQDFGFITNFELDKNKLVSDSKKVLTSEKTKQKLFRSAYKKVAPTVNGSRVTAKLIHNISIERR